MDQLELEGYLIGDAGWNVDFCFSGSGLWEMKFFLLFVLLVCDTVYITTTFFAL